MRVTRTPQPALHPNSRGGLRPYPTHTRVRRAELRDTFGLGPVEADAALDDWLHYASRSRLEPFVKLARTIRRYRTSILATIEWGFTNGLAESVNAAIGRLRTNARGYHHPDNLIAMIHLDRSGIARELPWHKARSA